MCFHSPHFLGHLSATGHLFSIARYIKFQGTSKHTTPRSLLRCAEGQLIHPYFLAGLVMNNHSLRVSRLCKRLKLLCYRCANHGAWLWVSISPFNLCDRKKILYGFSRSLQSSEGRLPLSIKRFHTSRILFFRECATQFLLLTISELQAVHWTVVRLVWGPWRHVEEVEYTKCHPSMSFGDWNVL